MKKRKRTKKRVKKLIQYYFSVENIGTTDMYISWSKGKANKITFTTQKTKRSMLLEPNSIFSSRNSYKK